MPAGQCSECFTGGSSAAGCGGFASASSKLVTAAGAEGGPGVARGSSPPGLLQWSEATAARIGTTSAFTAAEGSPREPAEEPGSASEPGEEETGNHAHIVYPRASMKGVTVEDLELRLDLRPIPARKQDGAKLLALLFRSWLSPFLRSNIKFAPRTSHTNSLGWLELRLQEQFDAAEGQLPLTLVFRPEGEEYPLSAIAGEHWVRLALAHTLATRTDFPKWVEAFGYEYAGPREDPVELLSSARATPLLEVTAGKPYLIAASRASGRIIADAGVGPSEASELSASDQQRLAAVAASGSCECMLCVKLRKLKYKALAPARAAGAAAAGAKAPKSASKKPASAKRPAAKAK
jgi:hypothetical protein